MECASYMNMLVVFEKLLQKPSIKIKEHILAFVCVCVEGGGG
jgi:hypothetical protein